MSILLPFLPIRFRRRFEAALRMSEDPAKEKEAHAEMEALKKDLTNFIGECIMIIKREEEDGTLSSRAGADIVELIGKACDHLYGKEPGLLKEVHEVMEPAIRLFSERMDEKLAQRQEYLEQQKIQLMMIRGEVFNIQRYCMNDGPGIRTTVFLKGCPLNCVWCHNPEAKKREPQILCRLAKCHNCGNCAGVCSHNCHVIEDGKHILDFSECVLCGNCVSVCQMGALEVVGCEYTADEVVEIIRKDKIFYDSSGGGVTISGGEPFMQPEFLANILRKSKEDGIHTAIETCGFANQQIIESVLEHTDLFLFDYKETDRELHHKYTGVYPEIILGNLEFLHKKNKDITLRCPIIPGYNDREDHFKSIAAIADRYDNIKEVNLEAYHNLGESKGEGLGLGKENDITVPDSDMIEMWKSQISAICKTTVK